MRLGIYIYSGISFDIIEVGVVGRWVGRKVVVKSSLIKEISMLDLDAASNSSQCSI